MLMSCLERVKQLRSWSSRIKEYENIPISKGIEIDKSVYDIQEKRLKTLIIKGMITYCLTMGGIGTFLSSIGCEYSELVVNVAALVTALLCSFLYYNYATENIGYILYFVVFAASAYFLKDYINSGFYAVVNDVMSIASIYLKMEGLKHYNERIDDRYTAITVLAVFIVMLMNILVNNYISRKARYFIATLLVLTISLIPIYFECEPDMIYAIMLLGGIAMAYLLRAGRHYRLYRRNSRYYHSKEGLSYGVNYKATRQMMIFGFVVVFILVNVISSITPKAGYDARGDNKYKKKTMEDMATIFTMGIEGLFNYYANTGGLSTGRLGGVSSIRLDYETDITVKFTPYSYDTLYLKQFVGATYKPYSNAWNMNRDFRTPEGENHEEVEALKEAYEQGKPYSAKGKLTVTNVEAQAGIYLPYYSDDTNNMVYYSTTEEYEYYPVFYGTEITPEPDNIGEEYYKIPVENYEVISDFCEEHGFSGSDEEIIDQVVQYFYENVPYTIKPGATPRKQDFVNYFLTKNKRGYCAHFASSTALILRYYGIATRYCEGYAISYDQVTLKGELVRDAKYSDYYDGYSAIGETALVEVDATDADAHAWVEAYIKGKGWVIVEATPPVDSEEFVDFWEQFADSVGGDDEDEEETAENGGGLKLHINDSLVMRIALIVLIIVVLAAAAFGIVKLYPFVKYKIEYKKAGTSDRLIMKYMRFIKKLKKKDKDFDSRINYEEQLDYLRKSGKMTCTEADKARLLDILSRAGFSGKDISIEDFNFAEIFLFN
ncbi:Transglutaminase-like superfamily protein [Eubacterium ruminantium]|nr:Transglutaminase-like superfamily protein [Eubacterium ruminantium]